MDADVLVVGAGPTGLSLAAELVRHGASVRVVDRNLDRAHESRALAVQPRTLEVLHRLGLADELVRRGNPAVGLRLHARARDVDVRLFDIGLEDTAYPYLLFVSQAETEAVLGDHLAGHGVRVERGVTWAGAVEDGDGVTSRLRHADGTVETVHSRYLAGCDGAHSPVRDGAGIVFAGGRYPQTFLLADLTVDGLEDGTAHAFLTDDGPLFFFPLGRPAPWRLIAMRGAGRRASAADAPVQTGPVSLAELQALADRAVLATGSRPRPTLHDPVWATAFRIHHRQAVRYRAGRVFLAGDAAHVHSPAGAQGMNTGIQDAANLGWKLAFVARGLAAAALLDSYDAERRPVGAFVLRFTDRALTAATSTGRLTRVARTEVVPRLLPVALRLRTGRALAFRTLSQLRVRYRDSPAVTPSRSPSRGPRPGDRLPDIPVSVDGSPQRLHDAVSGATFHLLLVGPVAAWQALPDPAAQGGRVAVHHLDRHPGPGVLVDTTGAGFARLHVRDHAHLVVRPDGHVGYRADSLDLTGAWRYLSRWLTPASRQGTTPR